ncbi:Gfo/Idh/MocA family protein [Massilia sp. DWR3-1-1]|uniref:Gfo/Idh/MocA family protein n=1 Tax=Massilia sp. DWR3-1-1 TaxID=2804559 RepID=UPI003CEC4AA1
MDANVRWGILGTGKIARAFAEALRHTPGAVLAGVASRDGASSAAFAAEFGTAHANTVAYTGYQGLADADGIDLVYIATPHPMHAENALMALHAGKGVLCEKAFTVNRREAEQVVALARAKGLFLMEAMWTRFMPALAAVRSVIAEGRIGTPTHLTADFGFHASFGAEHRVFNRALGGGALLDLGIYPLSIAASLLGPVQAVSALADMGPTGVDLQTAFTLRHAGGAISACACSLRARTPCELTVSGELGQVRMNTRFHRATSIRVTLADGSSSTLATPYLGNGYVHEIVEAQRCWRAGLIESPHMTHADTLALMGVMDAIRGQIGLRYEADDLPEA